MQTRSETQSQEFLWESDVAPSLGRLRVTTILLRDEDGQYGRMVTMTRLDGENFPTETYEDYVAIVLPVVREIVDGRYCLSSGIHEIYPGQLGTRFQGRPRRYSGPQRTKRSMVRCNNPSAQEAQRIGEGSTHQIPNADIKLPDRSNKNAPLQFPVIYW